MADVKSYLDGKEVQPFNELGIEIELQFDKDNVENKGLVTVGNSELVREDYDQVLEIIANTGVCQAPTYDITINEGGTTTKVFEGYLALDEDHEIVNCEKATFKIIEKGNLDWMERVAQGTSFEYLDSLGVINSSDYKFMPYVLNSIPDYTNTTIALIAIYTIVQQLIGVVSKIKALIIELSNPFEATAIAKAILLLAETVVLIAALVKLILDLVKLLIQPVKYHAGMNMLTMMQKACTYFGLTFKSPILEKEPFNKMIWIPEKFRLPNDKDDKRILGFLRPQPNEVTGYFKGSVADLILILKTMFYAKIQIIGTDLWLVPENYNIVTPQFQFPDLYSPNYKFNGDEIKKTTIISFDYDVTDKNTIQEFKGTSFQMTLQPKTLKHNQLLTLKGLREFRIPAALAKTKRELSEVEAMFSVLIKTFSAIVNTIVTSVNALIAVANLLIKIINKILKALKVVGIIIKFVIKPIKQIQPTKLGELIENRKGMMKIEYDNFTRPKVLIMQEAADGQDVKYNKIHQDNDTILSAKYLYENFHYLSSPVPSDENPTGNQCKIQSINRVPFCKSDYDKIRLNNRAYGPNGKEVKIVSGKYNPVDQVSDFTIRIPYLYETNLIEIFYEATGT